MSRRRRNIPSANPAQMDGPDNRSIIAGRREQTARGRAPDWHQLVAKPQRTDPAIRTGAFYKADAKVPVLTPVVLHQAEKRPGDRRTRRAMQRVRTADERRASKDGRA